MVCIRAYAASGPAAGTVVHIVTNQPEYLRRALSGPFHWLHAGGRHHLVVAGPDDALPNSWELTHWHRQLMVTAYGDQAANYTLFMWVCVMLCCSLTMFA